MTDIQQYKKNKERKALLEHRIVREELEHKEKQLELYEANTGKVNIEAHIELAEEYKQNTEKLQNAVAVDIDNKITADMLDW